MIAVMKKELKSYLYSPIGYIFISAFLLILSFIFFVNIYDKKIVNFERLFYDGATILTFIVPILTMRMFAEEKKQGTAQLLFTSPVSSKAIIFGKLFAAFFIILITELLSLMYFFILSYFGNTSFHVALVTLFGFSLLSMAYISCGMFISSITKNQIIAAIITFLTFIAILFLPGINRFFRMFSLLNTFNRLCVGVISFEDIIEFVLFIALFILLTIICLKGTIKKNKIITIFLLVITYIVLGATIRHISLPQIDVTENNLYSLTQASKDAIKNINDEVKIYTFGYSENSSLINLLEQYKRANNNIKYEILTTASNKAKIAEYELEDGYQIVIVEAKGSHKLIDGAHQFHTYDYTNMKEIDITEQVITNAILSLTLENKPVVYFLEGHNEYSMNNLQVIKNFLENEIYDVKTINLIKEAEIPEDCSIIAIMTPTVDISDKEAELLKKYINNGGNLIYFRDVELTAKTYPVLQSVIDLYGIKMQDAVILETEAKNIYSEDYPNIIFTQLSDKHDITKNIYSSKGYILMMYAGKIEVESQEKLNEIGVECEPFLTSSNNSVLVTDLTNLSADTVVEHQKHIIGAELRKKIKQEDGKEKESILIAVANNYFVSDYIEKAVSTTYPLSYFGNNKDIFLNSVAYLSKRDDLLTIRKNTNTTTYVATENQNNIVKIIIFGVPIIIFIAGISVYIIRNKK